MAADVLMLRATTEHARSERIHEKAVMDLERVRKAIAEIRRMTKLYQDRLDGHRADR